MYDDENEPILGGWGWMFTGYSKGWRDCPSEELDLLVLGI